MSRISIQNIVDRSMGLAIKTAGSAVAKTVTAAKASINGKLYGVAAGDVSLTNYTYVTTNGSTTTAAFTLATGYMVPVSVWVNSSGTYSISLGTTLARTSTFSISDIDTSLDSNFGLALVGVIYIDNNTGSTFTGGTTALDTSNLTVDYSNASVFPNW